MAVNLISAPVIRPSILPRLKADKTQLIWLLYPETKGRALEDMDGLFGKTGERNGLMLSGTNDDDDQRVSAGDESIDGEEDDPLLT